MDQSRGNAPLPTAPQGKESHVRQIGLFGSFTGQDEPEVVHLNEAQCAAFLNLVANSLLAHARTARSKFATSTLARHPRGSTTVQASPPTNPETRPDLQFCPERKSVVRGCRGTSARRLLLICYS